MLGEVIEIAQRMSHSTSSLFRALDLMVSIDEKPDTQIRWGNRVRIFKAFILSRG